MKHFAARLCKPALLNRTTPVMAFSFGQAQSRAPFKDRRDAGHQISEAIKRDPSLFAKDQPPVCIALPRGGVPVAEQIAQEIDAPLDVLIVRKLGAPHHPEYGVGALAEKGVCIVNNAAVHAVGATREQMAEVLRSEWDELERRVQVYRGGAPLVDVRGRVVLVVDDGLATGVSARAAIKALKDMGALRVILAVPVGSPDTVRELEDTGCEVICVQQPPVFRAVGLWYDDFQQTEDSEVLAIMERTKARRMADVNAAKKGAPSVNQHPAGEEAPPRPAMSAATNLPTPTKGEREVTIPEVPAIRGEGAPVTLRGTLVIPEGCKGIVLFAHGSGSSRMSPRNRMVAKMLQDKGMGTLLFDLLNDPEAADRRNVFDIPLLASRLVEAQAWLRKDLGLSESYRVGFFGASTGGGAAVVAASQLRGKGVGAVVSRGGRPDLAGEDALKQCVAPTLLIVGGLDYQVIDMNKWALSQLPNGQLEIVPGATHLFEEGDTLQQCGRLARDFLSTNFEAAIQS